MKNNYTDRELEEYLAKAIEDTTPDILDDLIAELDLNDSKPVMMRDLLKEDDDQHFEKRTVRRFGWKKSLAAFACAAAALVILIGGPSLLRNDPVETFAVVGLDVNPGIEISIDDNERVIDVTAVNEEGKDIISDLKFEGSDINVACNAIVGSMMTRGYLNDLSNSILLSVRSTDVERSKAIEKELSGNLNHFLEEYSLAAAILGQYVEEDDDLDEFAESNGISLGKAWLIRNLVASGSTRMTAESLLKLSTQELILLGQEKNLASENSYGKANTSKYIDKEKALAIAMDAAGVGMNEVTGQKIEFDCDDGKIVYEVEFVTSGVEYEYDIDAVSGDVLGVERESADDDDEFDDDDDDDDDEFEIDDDDDDDNDDDDDDDREDDD